MLPALRRWYYVLVAGELKRYRWTSRFLAAAGVLYVAAAVQRRLVPGREEIFPIAPWSLYSFVPNQVHDFSLVILNVNDRPLEPPIYFERSGKIFAAAKLNAARMAIQRLGAALQKHDTAEIASMRRLVEDTHLAGPQSVRYQVVARSYDPLQRWRSGAIDAQQIIATFTCSRSERTIPATQPAADAPGGR